MIPDMAGKFSKKSFKISDWGDVAKKIKLYICTPILNGARSSVG
jgi:hypothetical protein